MANSPATTAPPLSAAAIALNRFGLGARADEAPPANAKNWLLAQFDAYQPMPAAWAAQPTSLAIATELADERRQAMAPYVVDERSGFYSGRELKLPKRET